MFGMHPVAGTGDSFNLRIREDLMDFFLVNRGDIAGEFSADEQYGESGSLISFFERGNIDSAEDLVKVMVKCRQVYLPCKCIIC